MCIICDVLQKENIVSHHLDVLLQTHFYTSSSQKSLASLWCPQSCDKDFIQEPPPGLLCPGPFLAFFDQSIWDQHFRQAVPCSASRKCKRTFQLRMSLLLSLLYLSWIKTRHAGTCQICSSTPILWMKEKKVIHHSEYLESLCTEQTPPDVSISAVIYKRTKQLVRLIAPGGI